ncbi:MAG: hypothetical protein A2589_00960 [Candidatus Vogelbacteria bacterium RIFOXYD1_FULL_46_19]|uniref:Thymidylate kinase-like domain-containing protein n=1 Tax=Candidatus Vogelbacteria bacterium RIFOXYD1_FULL_46_19 TaxID=1802439 RepID=A0A1G2QFM7_9BACT|nr:MAG: hypothetical protein A2589_00960 [Candidatus Vogelbacteria bacterium RIFOXYD1_FULL_46_19]
MSQSKISVVAIEGLHNSGKSTQIADLYSNLKKEGIFVVVLRGHGFRSGTGLDINDPVSSWWQKHYPLFMEAGQKGRESFMEAEARATNKLYQELFDIKNNLLEKMKKNKFGRAVILLDRSIVSRLFIWHGHSKNPNFKDLLSFTYKNTHNKETKIMPIPDLLIVLNVSQKLLLKRNKNKSERKDKILLNKKIILSRYQDYIKLINNLPKNIKERTFIINAGRSKTAVQKEILKLINSQLYFKK